MKAIVVLSLLAALSVLGACGVKGPPQRPGAEAPAPANRTIIGSSKTTEAPRVTRPETRRPRRRFILDGLL